MSGRTVARRPAERVTRATLLRYVDRPCSMCGVSFHGAGDQGADGVLHVQTGEGEAGMTERPMQTSDTPPPEDATVYRMTFSGAVESITAEPDAIWVRIGYHGTFGEHPTIDAHLDEFHKRDLHPGIGLRVTLTLAFWDDGETQWHYLERLSVP